VIRLARGDSAKSWAPIRSTKGVSRLVSFGTEPARVDDDLIELLRTQEASVQTEPERLFKQGERAFTWWRPHLPASRGSTK
jgi:transcriptional antiterminator RfaH